MEPSRDPDELRPDYDFAKMAGGVRGKYAHRRKASGDGYEQTSSFPGAPQLRTLSAEEKVQFLTRVKAALDDMLVRSVVPILAVKDGQPGQVGTGTLFRVANTSFLVTASHILDEAKDQAAELFITDYRPGSQDLLHLGGPGFGHRELDVFLWELPTPVVDAMPNRRYLTVHHTDRSIGVPRKGTYLLHGYPSQWSDVNAATWRVLLPPLSSFWGLYTGDTNRFGGYDPNTHILLDTPRHDVQLISGPEREPPESFGGMSGCSIWRVYYEGLAARHWTVNDAVVVGIQTGVYCKGAVTRGTRWWVVDQLLRRCYPQLAGPLSLVTA